MLLRRRADCQCRNFEGYTVLHLGCRVGGANLLRSLIAKGANPQARTYELELTPLHVACQCGHPSASCSSRPRMDAAALGVRHRRRAADRVAVDRIRRMD
jgi:ankyrin repeat protein